MASQKEVGELISGIQSLTARAAELGLVPRDNGVVLPGPGEFTVNPSDIEDAENRKRYRYEPFKHGKMLHAWVEATDTEPAGPRELIVYSKEEMQKAIELGWQEESVHGPAGRLIAGEAPAAEPEPVRNREILAPGASPRPVTAATTTAAKPVKAAPKDAKEPKAPKAPKAAK